MRKARVTVSILTLLTLTNCGGNIPATVNGPCLQFHAITPTTNDWQVMSSHLNDQIMGHDAAWDGLCSANPIK
jgi:hypothetical protein